VASWRRILGVAAAVLVAGGGLAACQKHEAAQEGGAAASSLALDAPLPDKVPPGIKLIIGDPTTQKVLEHTGWIKELPFQIEWAQFTGGPNVTEAFHARALDVGSGANVPPIHATWVGIPVKIITFRQRKDPLQHPGFVFGIAPKSGINSLADFRGKKIAFSPSQVQAEVVLRTLKAQGLTTKDVKLVELPSSIGGDVYTNALAGNLVDAAPIGSGIIAQRYLQKFGKDGAKVLNHSPFRDDGANLFVRTETLQDPGKAAALKLYVKYWARAQEWMQSHREEWAKVYYVENQGVSEKDAKLILDAAGDYDIPSNWDEAVKSQQATIDLMGPETGQKPFDAESLFDRRFQSLAANAIAEYKAQASNPAAPKS
jgi:sulfonate transport system substrate-binding protein